MGAARRGHGRCRHSWRGWRDWGGLNGGGGGRCLVGAPLPAMAAAARRAAGMIGARAGRVQGGLAGRLLTSRMLSPTGSVGVVEAALAALTRGSGELAGGLGSEGWGGWGGGERGWSNLDCIPGPLAVAGAFPSWRRAFGMKQWGASAVVLAMSVGRAAVAVCGGLERPCGARGNGAGPLSVRLSRPRNMS